MVICKFYGLSLCKKKGVINYSCTVYNKIKFQITDLIGDISANHDDAISFRLMAVLWVLLVLQIGSLSWCYSYSKSLGYRLLLLRKWVDINHLSIVNVVFILFADDGNAENTLSMPESSIGNLLMPADLLQKAAILPAKTQIFQANINSDEALSLMADLFYPKDFTMTSLTTIIIDHRQSIPKLFPKKLAVPGANQFALGGTCS